jgi:hypothetical protein
MINSKNISIAAILATGAIALAGCGSAGNHTSAWTKSEVQWVEAQLTSSGVPAGPMTHCVAQYVEARITPSEAKAIRPSSKSDEALGKAAAASCQSQNGSSSSGTASSQGVPSATASSASDLYGGSACKQQLESSGCIEEVEQKEVVLEREGEANRAKEQQVENKQYEEEKARQENPGAQEYPGAQEAEPGA